MKSYMRINILPVFLAGLLVVAAPARLQAQAVVSDTQSTGKTIKQWFTEVKESKTVVGTMDTVKKTSSAIGTAKKSVSEYVLANKEKIEAKIAKVKEYKEKAEAYKEEYDKYKQQLDDNIAKAKEMKQQAEDGLETAKQATAAAKDAASGALDAAKEKAGMSANEQTGDATAPEGETAQTPEQTATAETAEAASAGEITVKPAVTPAVSTRQPFGGTGAAAADAQLKEAVSVNTEDEASLQKALTDSELKTFNALRQKAVLTTAEQKELTVLKDKVTAADNAVLNAEEVVRAAPAVVSAPAQKAVTVPAVVAPAVEKTNLRKAFTTSSLHRGETLAFAKAAMLPDGGTDVNGTVIVPKALAMYCNLSSEEALSSGKLDECLLNLNKERKSAQLFSGSDAPKVYNRALAQYVAASIAEAYKALQDAESFEEKFVDAVDFAPEPTAQDIYANIVELNKAVDMQMNGLLKVYSTQLAAQALFNYGGYLFVPEEKETGDSDV